MQRDENISRPAHEQTIRLALEAAVAIVSYCVESKGIVLLTVEYVRRYSTAVKIKTTFDVSCFIQLINLKYCND